LINVCLRDDCEGIQGSNIFPCSETGAYDYRNISTVKHYRIPLNRREQELRENWDLFAEANITITDRLHAMLFSVINGTPCIAMDNRTGKVFGVAKWLQKTNMIRFASNVDEAIRLLPDVENCDEKKYSPEILAEFFEKMEHQIREGNM
jgi:exopolysaccharide biosynthesis predicted pyruvyltransferase EpsI